MLEFTVVAMVYGTGYESQEHKGNFDSLSKAKTFAKDILNDADVGYTLVYNIDQELIAEYFD